MSATHQDILGYPVFNLTVDECVRQIMECVYLEARGRPYTRWLACINPHSYAVARHDQVFMNALQDADWLIPDGIGIVLAANILNLRISERITGSDIFEGVMNSLNHKGGKVFFIGSTVENLEKIDKKVKQDYKNVDVVGLFSPPFKQEYSTNEIDQMVSAINFSNPDVVWVGMTAPKQEKWIYEVKERVDVSFLAAIGAVFDFYIGNVNRSHPFFVKAGLEWFPRLLQQPRRLWRRTFVSAPIFLWSVFKERLTAARKN